MVHLAGRPYIYSSIYLVNQVHHPGFCQNFFNFINKTSNPPDKNCRIAMILDIMMILQILSSGFDFLFTELKKLKGQYLGSWFSTQMRSNLVKSHLNVSADPRPGRGRDGAA